MYARRLPVLSIVAGFAMVTFALPAEAGEGTLKLVPGPNAESAPLLTHGDESVADLLRVTPRGGALDFSGTGGDFDLTAPRAGIGYADSVYGLDVMLFGTVGLGESAREGVSGLETAGIVGNRTQRLTDVDPTAPEERTGEIQVGGSIDFGGLAVGADVAQENDLVLGRALTDYRLGMSYAGTGWQVGLQYMRSLSVRASDTTEVDAVEFGGLWQLSSSMDLVGGIQYWNQADSDNIDSAANRAALIFFGTRIQF